MTTRLRPAAIGTVVVIGGLGTIEGPIISAIVFFVLREFLAGFGSFRLIAMGACALVVMLINRRGIMGILPASASLFSTERVLVRRQ